MAAVAGCGSLRAGGKAAGARRRGTARARRQNAERWRAGPRRRSRALQSFESLRADPAVVAGFLDLEHAAVGRKADLAQLGQVAQKAPYAEVVAIVNGGFGTQARTAPARLVILLEVRVFVIDVQRGDDPLGNYARPASAAGDSRPAHFAREDQLHRFWSAQIDVLPDDFLEKLPPVPRAIPNLREGKLRLQHRKPVAKAGLSVCRWIGVRQY